AAHLRCVEDGDFEKAMRWEYLERTFAACEDDGTVSCSARQLQALGAKRRGLDNCRGPQAARAARAAENAYA
ncbi:unnamed protein product, partial [Symbiodinium microadriaticum]